MTADERLEILETGIRDLEPPSSSPSGPLSDSTKRSGSRPSWPRPSTSA